MSFESPVKKKRRKKSENQATNRQCIIHVRDVKEEVNRFLLNSWQVIYYSIFDTFITFMA